MGTLTLMVRRVSYRGYEVRCGDAYGSKALRLDLALDIALHDLEGTLRRDRALDLALNDLEGTIRRDLALERAA